MEKIVVYREEAQEWLDFALESMSERTGWKFPKVIEGWLFDFIGEVGFVIDPTSPTETLWSFTDNAYVNGVWGDISEFDLSEEEAQKAYEEGELLFYDKASGYCVESL